MYTIDQFLYELNINSLFAKWDAKHNALAGIHFVGKRHVV